MIDISIVKYFMIMFTIFSILFMMIKLWSGLSSTTLSVFKWLLYGLGILVLIWGLYNVIGSHFRLWEPLTLDRYFNMIFEKLGIKTLIDKLNSILGGVL